MSQYGLGGSPGDSEALSRVWGSIPMQVHATAKQWFRTLNRQDGGFGFITERTMVPFMLETGLSRSTLNKIWRLADIEENGMINLQGFTIALHLMYEARAGHWPFGKAPHWQIPPKVDDVAEQARRSNLASPLSFDYGFDDGALEVDDSDSEGGGGYDSENVFNGRWDPVPDSSEHILPESIRRDIAASFPTPFKHESEDYNRDDVVQDPKSLSSERQDTSLTRQKKRVPPSGRLPMMISVDPPSRSSTQPDDFVSDGGIPKPGNVFNGRWDPTVNLQSLGQAARLPSRRHPLNTLAPSGSSSLLSPRGPRTRSIHRRNSPDSFPMKNTLQDPEVPDITREIRNKTLVTSGGYSQVYSADWKKSRGPSIKVAVKILRGPHPDNDDSEKTLKRLKREARVWKSLTHPNIATLLGLVSGESGPGLVSPWYSHGNILQYLQKFSNVQREPLCEDVANGLRYLHEHDPSIVHGDLKGANILVGIDERAALCDFGLSTVLDNGPTGFTSSAVGGTLRFMAPEQLDDDLGSRTIQTDVYAYACTYAEIMTGDPPYNWHRTEAVIIRAISGGELPYEVSSIVSRHSLGFLGHSWAAEPAARPTMSAICQDLGIP